MSDLPRNQNFDTAFVLKTKLAEHQLVVAELTVFAFMAAIIALVLGLGSLQDDDPPRQPVQEVALVVKAENAVRLSEPQVKKEEPPKFEIALRKPERYVANYIARGYRLNKKFAREVVAQAVRVGREHKIDPLLILSVIAVESSFNPMAQSSVGAQGLMQVHTRVHKEKFGGKGSDEDPFSIYQNLKVGTGILKGYIERTRSVRKGLKRYVGAAMHKDDGGYGDRVINEYRLLVLAAGGKVTRAVHTLWKGQPGPQLPEPLPGVRGNYQAYEDYFHPAVQTAKLAKRAIAKADTVAPLGALAGTSRE